MELPKVRREHRRRPLRRLTDGGLYVNVAGFGEEKEALLREGYGANYDRLAALTGQYDLGNLFRSNLNIKPAEPTAAPAG